MSRTPVFGRLGRAGLPIAGAVLAVSIATTPSLTALAAPPSPATQDLSASEAVPVQRSSDAAVSVAIPSVVFGQQDGLPRSLRGGQHRADVDVWLAAGSPVAAATVFARGAQVRGCAAVALRAGAVTRLRCTVETRHAPFVLVVAVSVAGHRFHRAYRHIAG